MIRLVGLFFIAMLTSWANAQQRDLWSELEADSRLRPVLENMVQRALPFKVAEAKRLGLDTLPALKHMLDSRRKQLAYEAWMPIQPSVYPQQEERIKIRQIFFQLPQYLSASRVRKAEQRMDSIYTAILQGASFATCVQQYSDIRQDTWVSRLEVPEEMEKVVFQLQPGHLSKPFYTPQGIHLIQVLERTEQPIKKQTNRTVDTEALIAQYKAHYHYTSHPQGMKEWLRSGKTSHPLFTLAGKEYTAVELNRFATACPASRRVQWQKFVEKTVLDKAYADWESDPQCVTVLQHYEDSLLARAVCRQKLQMDGIGDAAYLQQYFKAHQAAYRWDKPRYQGAVIYAVNKRVAKQVRKFLKSLPPSEWKEAVRLTFPSKELSEVRVETGIFALGDHPVVDAQIYKQGKVPPSQDYPIIKVLGKKVKGPQDYREVRVEVWRDVLQDWEMQWMKQRGWKK